MPIVIRNRKQSEKLRKEREKLMKRMKKCVVKIPFNRNGGKNVNDQILKGRKVVVKLNKNSVKRLLKELGGSESSKAPEKVLKVYANFPLLSKSSSKRKKIYSKPPKIISQKAKAKGYNNNIADKRKRLNATPLLTREFGKKVFMSYVSIKKCDLLNVSSSEPTKKKHNMSVSFNESVEVFGEGSDEELASPMPVFLVATTINRDIAKRNVLPKNKSILKSPTTEDNSALEHENNKTEDGEDASELIIPTEVPPLKRFTENIESLLKNTIETESTLNEMMAVLEADEALQENNLNDLPFDGFVTVQDDEHSSADHEHGSYATNDEASSEISKICDDVVEQIMEVSGNKVEEPINVEEA